MTVVKIATTNPTKVAATKEAFELYFDDVQIEGYEAKSGVPSQPTGDNVKLGAKQRVEYIKRNVFDKDADFWVGIEGGIISLDDCWFNVQIVCIESATGKRSYGMSQGFPIPSHLLAEVKSTSVAKTMDRIFDNQGGVRKLTHGVETRYDLIKEGVIMALTGIINDDKW